MGKIRRLKFKKKRYILVSKAWWQLNGINDVPWTIVYLIRSWIWDLKTWWFWYSPPWKKTKRCYECAGSGWSSGGWDDTFSCPSCRGTGEIIKCYTRKLRKK